jgi:hypothetical protein
MGLLKRNQTKFFYRPFKTLILASALWRYLHFAKTHMGTFVHTKSIGAAAVIIFVPLLARVLNAVSYSFPRPISVVQGLGTHDHYNRVL